MLANPAIKFEPKSINVPSEPDNLTGKEELRRMLDEQRTRVNAEGQKVLLLEQKNGELRVELD